MNGRRPRPPAGDGKPGRAVDRLVAAARLGWRASPRHILGFALLSLVGGAAPVGIAWLTKLVVDRIAEPGAGADLAAPAVGLAALGAAVAVLPHATHLMRGELDRAVGLVAQDELYAAVGTLKGLARLESPAFLDRLRLALQSGQMTAGHVIAGLVDMAQSAVTAAGFVAALLVLNPVMTLAVAAAVLPALPAELAIGRRRVDMMLRMGPAERRRFFYADLLTSLPAAKEVRLFGLGGFLRARMLRELRAVNAEARKVDLREWWTQNALALLGTVLAGAGLVWAILAARAGRHTPGDVIVFISAVTGLTTAAAGIVRNIGGMSEALLLFDHYQAVVRTRPDLPAPARPRAVAPLRHGIELRDVWFRYGDDQPWVLRGVRVYVPRGRAVALVGPNGAGKSTLIKLLCRFYDPTRGAVLWDGVDLRELDVEGLRRRIGAVFQDYMTYDLSAAENVGVGDLAAMDDRGRIEAAARRAGAHDLLAGLPHGYDTLLSRIFFGEGDGGDPRSGVLLSGGEWQRVALARAFLRDARDLLILDEPSSGLDAEAEHEIHTRLRRHRAERTSVLISHRLSTIRDADRIVVLARGRVVETGRHDDLMAGGGVYARLFTLQARGYRAGPAQPGPKPPPLPANGGRPAGPDQAGDHGRATSGPPPRGLGDPVVTGRSPGRSLGRSAR